MPMTMSPGSMTRPEVSALARACSINTGGYTTTMAMLLKVLSRLVRLKMMFVKTRKFASGESRCS